MATANVYAFGGRPQPPARPQGVGGDGYPPSESPMSRRVKAPGPDRPRGGRPLGELSGGNWMGAAPPSSSKRWVAVARVPGPLPRSKLRVPFRGPSRAPPPGECGAGPRIATWLILPVVICLSQRLSHACPSISNYTVKLRMAH